MTSPLPLVEFAFPGPLRDRLVAAILSGAKTSTSSLVREYEIAGDRMPEAGDLGDVVDSAGDRVATIRTTGVDVVRLGDVPLAHARAEGEGYASVAHWRQGHERFWRSDDMRAELGAGFALDDDSLVVLARFVVVDA